MRVNPGRSPALQYQPVCSMHFLSFCQCSDSLANELGRLQFEQPSNSTATFSFLAVAPASDCSSWEDEQSEGQPNLAKTRDRGVCMLHSQAAGWPTCGRPGALSRDHSSHLSKLICSSLYLLWALDGRFVNDSCRAASRRRSDNRIPFSCPKIVD